jgi:hypothetical protein
MNTNVQKETDKNNRTVKTVEGQCQQEQENMIIAYLILNTVFYIEYFLHSLERKHSWK